MKRQPAAQNAREIATRVLHRVATTDAWAMRVLDAELNRTKLSQADRGLATELAYGTLRRIAPIDAALASALKKGIERTDEWLVAALRVGLYQLFFLDRVPARAAVNETVSVVRAARGATLAGLANAVMRRFAADESARANAQAHVLPSWLTESLQDALGQERAQQLITSFDSPPPLSIRVRPGVDADALTAALLERGVQVHKGTLASRALHLFHAGDPRALPGFLEGQFVVQDEGSQWIAEALGAQGGERVLDACAGHGGKSLALLDAMGTRGTVMAVDLYEEKLDRLTEDAKRLRLDPSRIGKSAIDWSVGDGGLPAHFHRVLVDAPCTGLGTVHRRPEILLRMTPGDISRMADLQLQVLERAATRVAAGGLLAYAVCSPTRAEGAGVAARFAAAHPEYALEPSSRADADGVARLGPWSTPPPCSPDAYQLVLWRKKS